ncbi:hypothetical protein BS78_04G192500 [Paspalum vaginatum]|nr:hypothetical protein BS78_04G192500 [Paspalum vaginatum]KAJ1279926.1 hypothetical protein BS78_04G192500 [Paspalum vaginatum]
MRQSFGRRMVDKWTWVEEKGYRRLSPSSHGAAPVTVGERTACPGTVPRIQWCRVAFTVHCRCCLRIREEQNQRAENVARGQHFVQISNNLVLQIIGTRTCLDNYKRPTSSSQNSKQKRYAPASTIVSAAVSSQAKHAGAP